METVIDNETNEIVISKTHHWKTRVFSVIGLIGLVVGFGYIFHEGYLIATDGFAAPFILGPDNDMVVQGALKLAEVRLEKGRAISEEQGIEASLTNSKAALVKLDELKALAQNALTFANSTATQQVSLGGTDLIVLANQKKALNIMLDRQTGLTAEAKKNFDAGTLTQVEYQQQQQALDQIQVALFNNDHTKMQTDVLLGEATLGLQSLVGNKHGNNSMPMPAILSAADLMGRIELQKLQLDALIKTALAEKDRIQLELTDIAILEKQVMSRPMFAAMNGTINAAFIPYNQMKNSFTDKEIVPGDSVYDCIWGIFACKKVGSVKDIVAGETVLLDPTSDSQTRGQFITLNLYNSDTMYSKVLRVRP